MTYLNYQCAYTKGSTKWMIMCMCGQVCWLPMCRAAKAYAYACVIEPSVIIHSHIHQSSWEGDETHLRRMELESSEDHRGSVTESQMHFRSGRCTENQHYTPLTYISQKIYRYCRKFRIQCNNTPSLYLKSTLTMTFESFKLCDIRSQ